MKNIKQLLTEKKNELGYDSEKLKKWADELADICEYSTYSNAKEGDFPPLFEFFDDLREYWLDDFETVLKTYFAKERKQITFKSM